MEYKTETGLQKALKKDYLSQNISDGISFGHTKLGILRSPDQHKIYWHTCQGSWALGEGSSSGIEQQLSCPCELPHRLNNAVQNCNIH